MCILKAIGRIIPVPDVTMWVAVIFVQSSKHMLVHPDLSVSDRYSL